MINCCVRLLFICFQYCILVFCFDSQVFFHSTPNYFILCISSCVYDSFLYPLNRSWYSCNCKPKNEFVNCFLILQNYHLNSSFSLVQWVYFGGLTSRFMPRCWTYINFSKIDPYIDCYRSPFEGLFVISLVLRIFVFLVLAEYVLFIFFVILWEKFDLFISQSAIEN